MKTRLWQCAGVIAVCIITPGPTGTAQAQDKKPNKDPLVRTELDKRVFAVLGRVINEGAALYNPPARDRAGCYRLYQGALLALQPLLDHRPDLKDAIDDGIAAAEKQTDAGDRAFTLRGVIDRIRAEVKDRKPKDKMPDDKQPDDKKPRDKQTLWERLGGEKNVRKIVDDFVELAAEDAKVDFSRGGKYKLTEKQLADFKKSLVEFISMATRGPLKYTGKDMKEAHKGMGITDAQFDALAADLKKALDKNGVEANPREALLALVETTRKAIVQKKDAKEDKEEEATASVTGKVTSKGKPLTSGTVSFHSKKDKVTTVAINEDGTFEIKVAPGVYVVTVKDKGGKNHTAEEAYTAEKGKGNIDLKLK
jgi:hemoglobin